MKKLKKLKKKKIIKYLGIDPVFGIYTRRYIEYLIKYKNLKNIYILDFENIGQLNHEIGYQNVNKKFKKLFKKKYKNVYIGRCFSGDEIMIASKKNCRDIVKKIKERSKILDLKFKYVELKLTLSSIIDNKINDIKFKGYV